MITCVISDRLLREETLADWIARNAREATWLQIREKDLSARELHTLVSEARRLHPEARLIVNTRVDAALAAGAYGAHLPSGSPPAQLWRKIVPPDFLLGVSCHTLDEAAAAEQEGATYILFGPVFPPFSKASPLAAHGLEGLAEAVQKVRIPVLALGGITRDNAPACISAGAAGVAGISLGLPKQV